ncbi:uncharacterized protein LOC104582997 [Brachypodium distachyon]|uniref:Uncharacterized protein n=1 Tax=Brachypodium distachyon TaxID=15368 RepID=A0A2K2D6G8_BRADI|nr:uncharacterized protein LOC104582997 [Brachypodium distachyon]PNT69863.1 hypothetical protein BRADI_2g01692v3 [Brachypodium distachyon]|eukprot:XP_024315782.1 uncharacterized protein LOC104582997 [Brachypodium distachyon]
MPVHKVRHARVGMLRLPAMGPPRHLMLVEGNDDSGFLLTVGRGQAGITAVSAVYIRAGGPPWYAVKMWANGPPPAPGMKTDSRAHAVLVEIVAVCGAAPGAVDVKALPVLTVPRNFLVGGAAGAADMVLPVSVRVDKMS